MPHNFKVNLLKKTLAIRSVVDLISLLLNAHGCWHFGPWGNGGRGGGIGSIKLQESFSIGVSDDFVAKIPPARNTNSGKFQENSDKCWQMFVNVCKCGNTPFGSIVGLCGNNQALT